MPTLLQKIRLAFKGWSRRREEAQKEFLTRSATWGAEERRPGFSPATRPEGRPTLDRPTLDMEGLIVAFVDVSGAIAYYLDTQSGDVVDVRDGSLLAAPRFRRVPQRDEASDAVDRAAFVVSHDQLAGIAAEDFRAAIASDRALERAWYNFKNDQILKSVEAWLRKEGLR